MSTGSRVRQRVAVYGLAVTDHRVLLTRGSSRSLFPGRWWLPGGGIEFGESPTQCLVREFREETGLIVQSQALTNVVSDITDLPKLGERIHSIRLLYTVRLQQGTASSDGDDTADAVEWQDLAEVANLPLMPFVRSILSESSSLR
jgi:8-oxo-dGTP diphosphatase